jgi:hypothetical protein
MKHVQLFEGFLNETYDDLLKTMEFFAESENSLRALRNRLGEINVEGVDSSHIREYADKVLNISADLEELRNSFINDETMWQSKGRFRADAEARSEKVWNDMKNYQKSMGY